MHIIENLDSKSNLNEMTKREIVYDLIKSTQDIDKALSLLKEMETMGVIKYDNIVQPETIVSSPQSQKDYIITLEELNQAIKTRSSETTDLEKAVLPMGINRNYQNLKKDIEESRT